MICFDFVTHKYFLDNFKNRKKHLRAEKLLQNLIFNGKLTNNKINWVK